MEHVMVPVKEEHAESVIQFLRWSPNRNDDRRWDDDVVSAIVDALDDDALAIVLDLARNALDGRALSIDELAVASGGNRFEVLGHLMVANHLAIAAAAPTFLVGVTGLRLDPTGGTSQLVGWSMHEVVLDAEVAQLLTAAAAR